MSQRQQLDRHLDRYLDVAATAPLRPEARAALLATLDDGQANPSSVHQAGHRARRLLDAARASLAADLGTTPAEIVFTAGGTEANNLAIQGLALANPRGRHIVTTPIEHPSVLETCRYLERVFGFELTLVPVDRDGRVDPADVAVALRDDTTLVTVGLANGEIGTVQPVPAIAALAKRRGTLVHTDAVQAAASLPLSFGAGWPGVDVDAMSIASHKFGGPQGCGALLVRRHLPLEPLLHGGGQERGARAGTENIAGIAGFAAAVRAATQEVGTCALELLRSRDALIARLLEEIPGAALTGHPAERLPGHASFVVPGTSGESLLVALDVAGFAVSSGSACAAGKDEPSPTLLAMGYAPEMARTAIRFTLPGALAQATIELLVQTLAQVSARAREIGRRAVAR